MLYGALTARENVAFAARLHGLDRPDDAAGAALAKIGAGHFANVRVSRLSRGQQQRVSISRALVHEPVVLLLDEPFAALDDSGARLLAELLTQLRDDGAALVVVTHSIAEGFPLATQCAVLKGGRVVHLAPSSGSDASQFSELYRRLVEHDD
jgi:ABC-type multidrug transport system ATPase subunit